MSIGNTRWLRIAIKVLIVLLTLFVVAIFYGKWMEGSLPVDGKLVNREALQAVLDDWKSLEKLGYCLGSESSDKKYVLANSRVARKGTERGIFGSNILINDNIGSIEGYEVTAKSWYRRIGILDALMGRGRFGDCTTHLTIESEPISMIFWVWPSNPGDGLLDAGFSEILYAVGYAVPET